MIRVLSTALRVVGLTYQLTTTTILLVAVCVGAYRVVRDRRKLTG